MFDKAIIASAALGSSRDIEGQVRTLRGLGVREVVLTHMVDVFDDAGDSWRSQAEAEKAFENEMSAFEACNMRVRAEVPLGHPAKLLGEMSDKHGAKLIVVESGNVALTGTGLGPSIDSDVFVRSETPVLVRPRNVMDLAPRSIGERVLFATDFSQTAARAFIKLVEIVRACGSRVDLLHVQDSTHQDATSAAAVVECDRQDALRLARLKERLLREGARGVSIEIIDSSPAEEISKRSLSSRYSLIIMGSRGSSGETDGILGAVSGPVTRESVVPVLLVPPTHTSADRVNALV